MRWTSRKLAVAGAIPGIRVFLDGEDVTNRCVAHDAASGYVELLLLDSGRPYADPEHGNAPAMETRRGVVRTSWPPLRIVASNAVAYWRLWLSCRAQIWRFPRLFVSLLRPRRSI